MSELLRVEEVSLQLPDCALRDVSLAVAADEYLAVMGPTGVGKTVLLELIAGLRRPDHGRVRLAGVDLTHLPACQRGLAYVPQDYALFPHMSVADNIAYGLVERGLPPAEITTRVAELAERLGVANLLARRPRTLSGGEAQRVALARALVLRAPLLLLDEPLAAVDERTRDELIEVLRAVRRQWPMAVIHVSHSFEEALSVADRLCLIQDGRIAQHGPVEEVMSHPNSAAVALFTGCQNIVEGQVQDASGAAVFQAAQVRLALDTPYRGPAQLLVRPEDLCLLPDPAIAEPNACPGRILALANCGPLVRLRVEAGGLQWSVLCSRREAQALALAPGAAVTVQLPPHPHVIPLQAW